ncbi:MAG TPA: hypothetical protein PLO63_05435 [Syntrophales bacterium]|jgi:hypothetical protein|nr:hypothetical protein [Syntrophales bacterium]
MKKDNSTQKLISLVDIDDPETIFHEVEIILHSIDPSFSIKEISHVFQDIIRLFEGNYPGFQACNTEYHDLRHTMEVFLATARLIHGAFVDGKLLSEKMINIDIISALMHDTGYNQTLDDTSGTGAKYTNDHILRSIDFCNHYFAGHPSFANEWKSFGDILLCTGFTERINEIRFLNQEVETAGKILGTADLLGQMADRLYLEKLLFLYYEFKEAGIAGYENEYDLLSKTLQFYHVTLNRMEYDLGSVYKHMKLHFRVRWGIDSDLYIESINNNIEYLKQVIRHEEYTSLLRRGGIVERIKMRGLQA